MPWYELESADDPRLDELARQYNLHPLHIEDCRSENESVKVDTAPHYTFAVFKPVHLDGASCRACLLAPSTSSPAKTFSSPSPIPNVPPPPTHWLAPAATAPTTIPASCSTSSSTPSSISTFPPSTHFDDRIDDLEDTVIDSPSPEVLQSVFGIKRELIDLRRVLVNTRDASLHLQRDPGSIIDAEHQPYIRDIYDHVARLLDSVETQRDLLNNTLDIYLSSVANRTNEVMKVLTVLGTIALPVLAISGIYGMNLKGLPFEDSPHGSLYVGGITVLCYRIASDRSSQAEVAVNPSSTATSACEATRRGSY